jgi:hypothetical protein
MRDFNNQPLGCSRNTLVESLGEFDAKLFFHRRRRIHFHSALGNNTPQFRMSVTSRQRYMGRTQNQLPTVVRLGRNASVRRQTLKYAPFRTEHPSITAVGMQHIHGLAKLTAIERRSRELKMLWNQLVVNKVGQQITSIQKLVVIERLDNEQPVLMHGPML